MHLARPSRRDPNRTTQPPFKCNDPARVRSRPATSTLLAGLALLIALAATAFLLLTPFYTGTHTTTTTVPGQAAPPPVVETRSATLLEVNGPAVLIPLTIPIALPALALAATSSRFRRLAYAVAAFLLLVFCLLSGFSIGMYYVPASIAMLISALLPTR